MTISTREMESTLKKLGFVPAESKSKAHKWYELNLEEIPKVMTKLSHGRKKISRDLFAKIARQIGVNSPQLRDYAKCTREKEDYYRVLAARNI